MEPTRARAAALRIAAAIAAVLAYALGAYLLLEATRPSGVIGLSFLLTLPAVVCAVIAYVADPWKERSHGAYLLVPVWTLLIVAAVSLVFLGEGIICVLMLSPFWLASGMFGTEIAYRLRRRLREGRSYAIGVLALPLVAMQVEPYLPLPAETVTVTRSTIAAAPPAAIWPLLRGIPDVQPGEGRWTVSQDIIGIPRPLGARLMRDGIGADRHARWTAGIQFRERITAWQPGRRIGWRFLFDDPLPWAKTDRHLLPDSPHLRVLDGRYTLTPLAGGRTRIALETRYRVTTRSNGYARLWGELLLGDIENNLLALIKTRAER